MASDLNTDRAARERLEKLVRNAEVLRQINSARAFKCQRRVRITTIVTIVLAAAVSFIGFSGAETLRLQLRGWHEFSPTSVAYIYNGLVLAILLVAILGLIYRWDERATRHWHAIEKLTGFIRDIDDAIALSKCDVTALTLADLSETRERYKGILEGLPPSSDKEFFRSKRDLAMKKARSHTTPVVQRPWWQRLASTPLSKRGAASGSPTRLNKLLLNDPSRVAVLQAVRDTLGSGAWIWGGFVRDPVWDRLEGYVVETPLDDVDVCFYDPSDTTREHDQRLEHLLRARCPNVKWSVKNQARPDLSPEAEAFDSLEAAVRAVPETATAVAVRLDRKNRLQVLAPLGLDDLFRGVVRPTRAGSAMRYERRLREKEWNRRWPCVDELDVGETR